MRRRIVLLLVGSFWAVEASPLVAQVRPVVSGSVVRIERDGVEPVRGRVVSTAGDTLRLVVGRRDGQVVALPGSLLRSDDARLSIRVGSNAGKAALIVGGGLGAIGLLAGICGAPEEAGCGVSNGGLQLGMAAGALFGAVGALVGGLAGAASDRFEPAVFPAVTGPGFSRSDLRR